MINALKLNNKNKTLRIEVIDGDDDNSVCETIMLAHLGSI